MLILTYTQNSSSKGIYFYSFNQSTGESKLLSTVMSGDLSFISISDNHKNFYAVNEFNNEKESLTSFLIKDDNTLLN